MRAFVSILVACVLATAVAQAGGTSDPRAAVRVDERVGEVLPLDTVVTDQRGVSGPLGGQLEAGKPVLLAFAYYHCPGLCDVSLRELAASLRSLDWKLGEDYSALTVSIDPGDTTAVAAAKRSNVLSLLKSRGDRVWPFFIASGPAVERLTSAAGYHYRYDEATDQFAHPAVSLVLTPEGRIARYVYGPTTDPETLGFALREARLGRGGISDLVDRTVLSCFRYDPSTHRYEVLISSVMQGGALLIAAALSIAVWIFARRGRARRLEA